MKTFKFVVIGITLIFSISCKAQSNEIIVNYFKNSSNINLANFLFTPDELIELCIDSLGRKKIEKAINLLNKRMKSSSIDEAQEKKVLLNLICNKIKSVKVDDPNHIESKLYIHKILNSCVIDFKVNEELLIKRFNASNDVSYCSVCVSMYVFFVYDPELYLKVRNKKNGFISSDVHFPNAFILQDCNTPIEITRKIQSGLLELIENNNTPLLKKIYTEIKECDLTNRCD